MAFLIRYRYIPHIFETVRHITAVVVYSNDLVSMRHRIHFVSSIGFAARTWFRGRFDQYRSGIVEECGARKGARRCESRATLTLHNTVIQSFLCLKKSHAPAQHDKCMIMCASTFCSYAESFSASACCGSQIPSRERV